MSRIRIWRTLVAATVAVVVSTSVAACPGGEVAAATLGGQLKGLADKVNTVVQNAGTEARGVVTQAGSHVLQVIDQATTSFEDSLDKSVKRLDATVAGRLQQIESMVNAFVDDAFHKATAIQEQAQQLVLTLPLANGQPQVRSWSPHFVTGQSTVSVTVEGIFTQTQQAGSEPRLQIGGQTFGPANGANTTQRLIFLVPGMAFPPAAARAVTPGSATLTVPYHSPVLKRDKTARYTILFGTLPPSPGRFRLRQVVHNDVHEQQKRLSASFHQAGAYKQDADNEYCTDTLPAGDWRIKPFAAGEELFHLDDASPHSIERVTWTKKYKFIGDAFKQCVQVWTRSYNSDIFPPGWHSGDITFHLEWTIERTVHAADWADIRTVDLTWNDRKDFVVAPGEWLLVYEPFQGGSRDIAGPYESDWLRVAITGQAVAVSTLAADQVRF